LLLPVAARYYFMNRIPVATFKSSGPATQLQQRLTGNGIPAEVHDGLKLEKKVWFASGPEAGTRLEVPAEQFERAYDLLVQWDDQEGVLRDAIRCPECNSPRVSYPQYTRRSFLPNLIVGALAAIGRVEKEFYCEECQYTWPRESHPAHLRPHMAPYYFIEDIETSPPPSKRDPSPPA
jgi:hypothetical protein